MRRPHATVVALLTTLALSGLASCSDDEPSDEPSSDSTSGATDATGSADPTGDADGAEVAPALDRPRPAQKALGIDKCQPGDGEVAASGVVRNREKKPVDFVVTVDWLDEQSAVVASKFAVLEDVAPGKPTKWQVSTTLDVTATACSARAASGKLLD